MTREEEKNRDRMLRQKSFLVLSKEMIWLYQKELSRHNLDVLAPYGLADSVKSKWLLIP